MPSPNAKVVPMPDPPSRTPTQAPQSVPTSYFGFLVDKITLVRSTSDHCEGLYVEIDEPGYRALYPLTSSRVAEHLNHLYLAFENDEHICLTDRQRKEALVFLRTRAVLHAVPRPVFKRTAWLPEEEALWIDLSRPDGQCVRVTAAGWTLATPADPLFVRYITQRPLPVPQVTSDGPAAFQRLLPPGITPESAKLLLGTLLGFFLPPNFTASFSYPVLEITGEPGSGKSTLTKAIKMLVDNEVATVAARPAKVDDLFVIGRTSHLLAFDNLDGIRGDLSDAICQATTGSAIVKRRLYTDSEVAILKVHSPFLINGLGQLLQRSDIVDRSISIRLQRITDYDPEAGDHADAALPEAFGYLLDLMSKALANYASISLDNLPRLATVAKLAAAAEPFGCATPFVTLLHRNQAEALVRTDEDHPVIEAVYELLADTPEWRGTYKDLLAVIATKATARSTQSEEWPRTPKKLSLFIAGRLRLFAELGVVIRQGAKQNTGRLVTLSRTDAFRYERPTAT